MVNNFPLIKIYTQVAQGQCWLERYHGKRPIFACVLGFTATGLIPGISAAGATPADRRYTAIADAEFLYNGPRPNPAYPLPPLQAGASPVLISRAVVEGQQLPLFIFNAGLPLPPAIPAIDLHGAPAQCVSTGHALEPAMVEHLLQAGLTWGEKLATTAKSNDQPSYLILSECVVGGTTTALALLTGLGIPAIGKVNSSHPTCNHEQKWHLVQQGLGRIGLREWEVGFRREHQPNGSGDRLSEQLSCSHACSPSPLLAIAYSPFSLVAAVGDPMQIVVAGMAIAASRQGGVMLAGGTQMLAVYALARAIAQFRKLSWQPEQIVIGTTRWVAEDPTGDTIGLAESIRSVPLLATQLSFGNSRIAQLRLYEKGFVKEGVGAGGCAIAAHLYQGWEQTHLLRAIETLTDRYQQTKQ
jgi:NaMN:DMB phosphoribosyltransferase